MKSASLLISGRGCAPEWLHNHAFRSASFDADVDAFRGTVDTDAGQVIVNGLAIGGVIDDAFDAFGLRRESHLQIMARIMSGEVSIREKAKSFLPRSFMEAPIW